MSSYLVSTLSQHLPDNVFLAGLTLFFGAFALIVAGNVASQLVSLFLARLKLELEEN